MGLLYRLNDFRFPTSKKYQETVHAKAITFLGANTLLEDNMKVAAAAASNGVFSLNKKLLKRLKIKLGGWIEEARCASVSRQTSRHSPKERCAASSATDTMPHLKPSQDIFRRRRAC